MSDNNPIRDVGIVLLAIFALGTIMLLILLLVIFVLS